MDHDQFERKSSSASIKIGRFKQGASNASGVADILHAPD
jgi:hypothetical protein